MKKVIQNYKTGKLELVDAPIPVCLDNTILVKNMASLISIGTERSIIELGKKSLLGKARSRPDLVKRFLDKAKKEGYVKTLKEALGRLDEPVPLGYSSAGIIIEAGKNINTFSPGDKVVCIGAGYASHSEIISIPENFCCIIPNNLSFKEASFGMLGIIALHGVRCGNIKFGETVAVMGLGLLGLLTIQILSAYGCHVIGYDIDKNKVLLARKLGFSNSFDTKNDFSSAAEGLTNGNGVDAVILTVATESKEPVDTAINISKMKGKIVLVGVSKIAPERNEMWHKEVEIVVSKAGGPGILDPFYELKGIDYPFGYVRWTENRNLEEFLRLISEKKVDVNSLISHEYSISEAKTAYGNLLDKKQKNFIGVVLNYPGDSSTEKKIILRKKEPYTEKKDKINIGVIGAGLFAKALLLPALSKIKGVNLVSLSALEGETANHICKKYGFLECTSDYMKILNNKEINGVFILTRHSSHAEIILKALESKKHVYVEKPICINEKELNQIITTYDKTDRLLHLMVGYNRRFSSLSIKAKGEWKNRIDPMVITYRINAGFVPSEHWVHSPEEGGSRIIGEICHFVDLIQYIITSNPKEVFAYRISGNNKTCINNDNVCINLKFDDGSIASIIYTGSGDKAFSRERVEMFCEGRSVVLDDFRRLNIFRNGHKKRIKLPNQDMGYNAELRHFINIIKGNEKPKLTPEEIFLSTLTVFKINESLQRNTPIQIQFGT